MASTTTRSSKKLILVIGGTGAQGIPVVQALLAPASDGAPSPYAVRVLTRNPDSSRAQQLTAQGVEIFKGSTDDFDSVYAALDGVYGAFVNTDSFTIGEAKEIYTGMRIFELAKQIGTLKHYVWSGLDYSFKVRSYDLIYRCEHHDAKGRVGEWMRAQPSVVSDRAMSWSILSTMVYMEMLTINKRADGTYVFAAPIGDGHIPMHQENVTDLYRYLGYIFDNCEKTSAQELEIASDWVDWNHLVSTFIKVTGKPAVYVPVSLDEWFNFWDEDDINRPIATERFSAPPDGSTTWRQNFTCWWSQYRDDIIKRDFKWLRRVNPDGHNLESWMRATGYTGEYSAALLKNAEDGKSPRRNLERVSRM
ncbi:NAD(P)-binding protein [Dichomitus squalens LYAD-421 SS1]|uniref:NAD(P)-binding protein n=1 Tax=Dichomitus squalens (strain LYAD-421) TaxID=732165 RepID=R7T0M0_DICSQ|nr:NAD(P)-binding protein [Dichomitus squalens LYAD-421 SS1]EJF61901.1 NAD(P)-binding protein [Dichomitus squalens LYAD-421 SS1]